MWTVSRAEVDQIVRTSHHQPKGIDSTQFAKRIIGGSEAFWHPKGGISLRGALPCILTMFPFAVQNVSKRK
jgi:hypothetical protein